MLRSRSIFAVFAGFLADDPCQKGWLLGRECCSWVWNGLGVLLKAWLLALKNFIDSAKVVGNKLGIPIATCLS